MTNLTDRLIPLRAHLQKAKNLLKDITVQTQPWPLRNKKQNIEAHLAAVEREALAIAQDLADAIIEEDV